MSEQIYTLENEKRYKQLFENSCDALMTLEPPSWKFTSANKAALKLFGVATVAEFTLLAPWNVSPQQQPDGCSSAEKGQEMIETALREGCNFFAWEHQTIDGKTFPADVLLTHLKLGGQILVQATVRDITKRQQAEDLLHKREEQFRTLVESTNDWIWEMNANGLYTYVSPHIETLTGYKPQEVLGKSPFDFMSKKEAQRVGTIFKKILAMHAPILALANTNICKDGTLKVLETNGVAFFDKNGNYLGYRGIDRDITERQHTAQILHDSEEKFRSITSSAQDAILMMNNDGEITYWNEAAEKIFGYSVKEAMGKILHTFITPQRFFAAHKIGFSHFKKTGKGPVVGKTLELVALRKDGTEFPIELSLSATMIDGLWNAIGIIRDISERKEMENELKLKEEMMLTQSKQAAMGDMIAMIAHQWRQPLAAISMDVNTLMVSIGLEEEITIDYLLQHANSIYKQVHQLSETIDNFRNFFKPDQEKEKITIEDTLNSTLNIIGTSLENNNITLTIKNTSKSFLLIHKASLIQVLLNILGNAKDVLLAKEIQQAKINITANEENEIITLSICDNAGGIPESIMNKIGQPYFTTKQALNGTGLGLYISRTIIEKHLFGTFTWHNEDQGACFVITLNTMRLLL